MQAYTLADITPNGTPTALGSAGIQAIWIAITATGTTIRVGDSNVGASRGVKIPTGTTLVLLRGDFNQGAYDLGKVYVYAGSGSDSVSVTYGQ